MLTMVGLKSQDVLIVAVVIGVRVAKIQNLLATKS